MLLRKDNVVDPVKYPLYVFLRPFHLKLFYYKRLTYFALQGDDKVVKDAKKRGRPSKPGISVKSTSKKIDADENGEPVAKRGRGRPKKTTKSKPKVSKNTECITYRIIHTNNCYYYDYSLYREEDEEDHQEKRQRK